MKKLIFKKLTKDLTQFFLIASISITLIIWVIQAVNFLDLVSDDGHSFRVYFLYTLLSLPKIFSKTLPFIYFVSTYYILLKYENNNELIIFWTIGIDKLQFINVLIKLSIFYLILQLLLTTYIVPKTLDKARSFIRSSNVDYFGSIIKERKFIDTVKNLTMFVDEKNDNGDLKNIFLKETFGINKYQIIYAKNGKIINENNNKILLLENGEIISNNYKKSNTLKFSETKFNLSKFSTRTTIFPKLQENTTYEILYCMNLAESFTKFFDNKKLNFKNSRINCNLDNYKDYFQEIFKRIFLPFYLPILSLVACLTIIKSKDDYKFEKYKFILFVIGVIVIIVSELSVRYSGVNIFQNIVLGFMPLLIFLVIYFYFMKKFKTSNVVNQ